MTEGRTPWKDEQDLDKLGRALGLDPDREPPADRIASEPARHGRGSADREDRPFVAFPTASPPTPDSSATPGAPSCCSTSAGCRPERTTSSCTATATGSRFLRTPSSASRTSSWCGVSTRPPARGRAGHRHPRSGGRQGDAGRAGLTSAAARPAGQRGVHAAEQGSGGRGEHSRNRGHAERTDRAGEARDARRP